MRETRWPAAEAWLLVIIPVAAVLLWLGWAEMFFVCDDAYIAFRYILNRHLGYGYVWNPPPFAPVEGYTSFLWVVLLDGVWTVLGPEPPVAAPVVGLSFSLGTLLVTVAMAWVAPLGPPLERWRPAFVALVALGLVTNKTFLVWTSSGLETSMFVFLHVSWLGWATLAPRGRLWVPLGGIIGAALTLCRPDGLLYLAASPLVVWAARGEGRALRMSDLLALIPVSAVGLHMAWRVSFYGDWLPNTYYAKVAEPWLAGGGNHFWLYFVENGWFWWLPLVILAVIGARREGSRLSSSLSLVAGVVVAHALYYIWRVGGDHFEFRIYAHVPSLVFVGTLPVLAAARLRPIAAWTTMAMLVTLTWPIAWTDHWMMKAYDGPEEIKRLQVPLADKVPTILVPWATVHDAIERATVRHALGVPQQTHKMFRILTARRLPKRSEALAKFGPSSWTGEVSGRRAFPVVALSSVGIAAWRLPYVAIIDRYGLNDRVIARNYPDHERFRFSAHDRLPPAGYIPCFQPNLRVLDRFQIDQRREIFGQKAIERCERDWLEKMLQGRPLPVDTTSPDGEDG